MRKFILSIALISISISSITAQVQPSKEVTTEDYENAVKASEILFSKNFKNEIKQLPESLFLDVFEGVKHAEVSKVEFSEGLDMIGALAAKTDFLSSNADARRALKENAIAVNKEKIKEDYVLSEEDLIHDKYIILSRGKKTNFILQVV